MRWSSQATLKDCIVGAVFVAVPMAIFAAYAVFYAGV